jgi:hypothetical protein
MFGVPLTWRFVMERVTGIEPALSAGKSVALPDCHLLIL